MADNALAAKNDLNQARQNHGVFAFATDRDRKDGVGTIWNLAHGAAYRGDVPALEKILDEPDEMTGEVQYAANAQHPHDGRTLLHSSVKGVPSPLYEYLVNDCGANVDARDHQGRTPLLYAAANGSPRAITRLIALGADEQAVDNEGCGAILVAAQSGHIRTVLWLFQGGVPVVPANDGRTALHMAAFAGQSSEVPADCMLERLVAIGLKLEDTTFNGFTAMHYAALGDNTHCIQKLFDLGGLVSPQDSRGLTPLMIAASYGSIRSVKLLINLGSSVSLQDGRGYSAFHFAAEKGRLEVINFMFAHVPLLARLHDSRGRRRRPTLGSHLRDIVSWPTNDPSTTPYTLASRNDHWDVLERLNGALLMAKVPHMPDHELVLQMEIYGVSLDDVTMDEARIRFMEYLKQEFGMVKNKLPPRHLVSPLAMNTSDESC